MLVQKVSPPPPLSSQLYNVLLGGPGPGRVDNPDVHGQWQASRKQKAFLLSSIQWLDADEITKEEG